MRRYVYTILGLGLSGILIACGPEREEEGIVGEEPAETVPGQTTEAPAQVSPEQQQFAQQADSRITELENNLQNLQQQVTAAGAKAGEDTMEELNELDNELNELRMDLREFQTQPYEAGEWTERQSDFEQRLSEVERRMEELQAKVGKKPTE